MPAREHNESLPDLLVVKYAEWAGDIEYLLKLHQKFALRREGFDEIESGGPEAMICQVLLGRLKSIIQNLKEMGAISVHGLYRYSSIIPRFRQPVVGPTEHLRGVVRRTGARDFELRAYLTDLKWQKSLKGAARLLADQFGDNKLLPEHIQGKKLNYAWIAPGEINHIVNVSPLGMIKSRVTWTIRDKLPDAQHMQRMFEKTLVEIERAADSQKL